MQSHMDTDPHAQQDSEQDTPVHRLDNTMRNAYVRQIQVGDICMGYDFLPKNTTTHACSTVSINTLRLFSATGGRGSSSRALAGRRWAGRRGTTERRGAVL